MAGMRLLGAAGQGALECGAAVGEAGRAPGVWGKGAAGTLELELLWVGRKVGFALRTPSGRQDMGSVGWLKRAVY